MPKSFEEAIAQLEKVEGGAEYIAAITARLHEPNNEAKNLRERLRATEQSQKAILEKLGVETPELAIAEIEKTHSSKAGKESEIEKLSKKISEMQQIAEDRRIKLNKKTLYGHLDKGFGDNVPAKEFIIKDLIESGKVVLKDDETPAFKDGENIIDFGKGIEGFIAAHPELVVNKQKPGSGQPPPNGGGTGAQKTMRREEFSKMDPAAQFDFMRKEGGKIVD